MSSPSAESRRPARRISGTDRDGGWPGADRGDQRPEVPCVRFGYGRGDLDGAFAGELDGYTDHLHGKEDRKQFVGIAAGSGNKYPVFTGKLIVYSLP